MSKPDIEFIKKLHKKGVDEMHPNVIAACALVGYHLPTLFDYVDEQDKQIAKLEAEIEWLRKPEITAKTCPLCKSILLSDYTKCPYCGYGLREET